MKKILATFAASALLFSGISPSQAVEYPLPTWGAETGAPTGFTWGNWLACRSDYQLTDCIESVYWLKTDGSKVAGTWVAKDGFTFEKYNPTWNVLGSGESAQNFKVPVDQMGQFTFDGLVTPCNDNAIVIDARPTRFSFQVNAGPTCDSFYRTKFEERFEISVKSKNLKGYVGGVSSNGKNPEITFTESGSEQTLTMKLNFAYTAWSRSSIPGEDNNVCEKNEYKASEGGWGLWSSIFWVEKIRDPLLAVNPGDMIAGTNGWNCGGYMYWDPKEVALVMSVGAPHYDLDGSVIDGWYEGAIRGRYITSRFGIKPQVAAGSVRLEVVYTSGEIKIATITAKYDPLTDWLYLNGYGFSYSAPKLMVKFAKPVEEVKPIVKIPPAKVLPKKKTITCAKGKTTKKVSAIKPVCPAGYKKKA